MEKKLVKYYLKYLKYLFQDEGDTLRYKDDFMVQTYTHVQLHRHLSSSAVSLKLSLWHNEFHIETSYQGERLNMFEQKMGMMANNVRGKSGFDCSICHKTWLTSKY